MDKQEVQEMMEAMEAKKTEMEGGNRKFWSPPSKKEGTFPIRILPPLKPKGEKIFFFTHRTHWLGGISFECINQTLVDKNGNEHQAESCPICQFVRKLYNTAERETEEWKLAGNLSAKARYVFRVVVRGSDDETKPVFFESGKTIFEIIYHVIKETDYGVIVDPKNGRDFNIVKTGTGRRSRYEQSLPAASLSPIFTEPTKMKEVLENAMKLDYSALIEFTSAERLTTELKESMGMEEKAKTTPSSVTQTQTAKVTTPELVESSVESSVESDEIDDILSEFV